MTWFNRERFEHAAEVLGLPRARDLTRAAEKSGYRLDALQKASAGTPQTGRRARPTAKPGSDAGRNAQTGGVQAANAEVGLDQPGTETATQDRQGCCPADSEARREGARETGREAHHLA